MRPIALKTMNAAPLIRDDNFMFKVLDTVWSCLPHSIGVFLASTIVFMGGLSFRGDGILMYVHFLKLYTYQLYGDDPNSTEEFNEVYEQLPGFSLKPYKLEGVLFYILANIIISLGIYFGLGGFLHWWFYVRQKDHPETWKCQPNKWLSRELELHEIKLGSKNLIIGSCISGLLACYSSNGGATQLYTKWDEYGWIYLILSIPIHFLYQDAANYYAHRFFHSPSFYKKYHKVHHLYKQPTPFSTTAMHEFDFVILEALSLLPMFVVPLHSAVYFITMLYIYYYAILSHSGIVMKPICPWQAESTFHDNHHQYFHCNYGANTTLWDRMHGTLRRLDRIYTEDIFGSGKSVLEATKEELQRDEEERANENVNADYLPEENKCLVKKHQ